MSDPCRALSRPLLRRGTGAVVAALCIAISAAAGSTWPDSVIRDVGALASWAVHVLPGMSGGGPSHVVYLFAVLAPGLVALGLAEAATGGRAARSAFAALSLIGATVSFAALPPAGAVAVSALAVAAAALSLLPAAATATATAVVLVVLWRQLLNLGGAHPLLPALAAAPGSPATNLVVGAALILALIPTSAAAVILSRRI